MLGVVAVAALGRPVEIPAVRALVDELGVTRRTLSRDLAVIDRGRAAWGGAPTD